MERLTQKRNEKNKHLQMCIGWYELPTLDYYVRLINETPNQMYSKLGQLEDIEEGLGIDLITLFKEMEKPRKSVMKISTLNIKVKLGN